MFTLTRNEQRVVVLVLLALLTAAFIRYWRDLHPQYQPKPNQRPEVAIPLPSPNGTSPLEESDETRSDQPPAWPSPQLSP